MLLKAALNGARTRADHPAIPLTPGEQAREATAAVAAGAGALHVHVRDADGQESLAADDVARTLDAIRAACPGVPIGVSTGAWIEPQARRRLVLIRRWTVRPDFASVNLHEAGATEVIQVLLDAGIGVEAGLWSAPGVRTLMESGLAGRCLRILIEPAEAPGEARANLERIERALAGLDRPRLLHGLDASAWDLLMLAIRRRYDARTGFEDTLALPDGSRAENNAALVAAARQIVAAASLPPAGPGPVRG
jgi:uncharacterized protein (DUF849 family)